MDRELCVQERVVTAVRELREPYRTALYMRYFRELAPAAIAAELGVPVATVNTRLLRGRALLREALTREFGSRDAWVVALLPLCPSAWKPPAWTPSGAAPAAGSVLGLGAIGMKMKLGLCALAATLGIVAWQWGLEGEPGRPVREVAASRPAAPSAPERARPEPPAPEPLEARTEVEAAPQEQPAAEEPVVAVGLALSGDLIDLAGQPLGVTGVRFTPEEGASGSRAPRATTTDRSGRFAFADLEDGGEVTVAEPGLATVIAGGFDPLENPGPTTVVAAPARALAVRVVDDGGDPVAGARVAVRYPVDMRSRFPAGLEQSRDMAYRASTDLEGIARVIDFPAVPGSTLVASKDGFRELEHDLDVGQLTPGGENALTLVLEHLAGRGVLSGRVVDEIGLGIAEARVEMGHVGTRTDAEGWFHFDLTEGDPFEDWGESGERLPERLLAARPGYLPAVLEAFPGAAGPEWPDPIVLQIVDETLAISGRVVDQDGEPLEGTVVFLPRAHLIAGGTTVEAEMMGATDFFLSVSSGRDGRFEFRGLLDREYDLAAYQPGTLVRGDVTGVPAGSEGVEIRIDTGDLWSAVRGRVTATDGTPIPGVIVRPSMTTQAASGTTGYWTAAENLDPVTTGPEGRFALANVPRTHVHLNLEHSEIMNENDFELPGEGAVEEGGELTGVELVVTRRMRFQIVLDDPAEADSFRVLMGDGSEVWPFAQTANFYGSQDSYLLLTEGRSLHLFVGEDAAAIVLEREGREVRRIPLSLRWREDNLVR